jgi:hypothetical protein
LGWLANTDATPCTSLRAVLNYFAKYCSKAEKQTQPYKEMISELIPMVNNSRPMVSLVAKMMNKLIGERDWPAMEVSHLLLDLPLTECSHLIQPVDCRRLFHLMTARSVMSRIYTKSTANGILSCGGSLLTLIS